MDQIDGEFGGGFSRQMSENNAKSRIFPWLGTLAIPGLLGAAAATKSRKMDEKDGQFDGAIGKQMNENEAQARFLPFLLPLLGGAVGGGLLGSLGKGRQMDEIDGQFGDSFSRNLDIEASEEGPEKDDESKHKSFLFVKL